MTALVRPAIRRCNREDAAALALAGKATFLESYAGVVDGAAIRRHCEERQTAAYYEACLADPAHALWIAEVPPGAAPVGYLHLSPPDLPVQTGPGDIEIKRIYLLSKFHGSGAGRALFEAALEEARARGKTRLLLGVYKQNAKALGFYERMGFTRVGEREFDVGGAVYEDWVLARVVG
ncbi:GNAT family N-acetyltransferase [Marinicauda algicola]|uniref:GNAT family N-acetyltransferase n=1 Tax=Marinicauda algicola TaxID=2029849 RepID=A0A4V3RYI3_9PROT|nr:GNAT family N-acetyltransferase [Marinicauda algicola]TGY90509.1 GNAT family N-acetyltransferase [Marinicauda algicola]